MCSARWFAESGEKSKNLEGMRGSRVPFFVLRGERNGSELARGRNFASREKELCVGSGDREGTGL